MAKNIILNKPDLRKARKRLTKEIETIIYEENPKYKDLGKGKTYHILTYGCQGNEADSEVMAGIFEQLGYTYNEDASTSDVVLLNTCAIRENAENRIWGVLGNLKEPKRNNKDMIIGICGCMPQEEHVVDRLLEKYREIDLVFGTHNIYRLPDFLYEISTKRGRVVEVLSFEGSIVENLPKIRANEHKAWINIMYGCDEFCTYCIVPYTRGKERSRHKDDIISEVKCLVKQGYKEITLLGQNVNAYGKDLGIDYTFGDLLRDLDQTGIERIHYTTSHPRDLDLNTIKAMGECKSVMPNLHLPVQSGDNTVLKRMNRKYTHEEYVEKIKLLREYVPGISITTDIIVAFPGETEEQFQHTLDLVEEVGFEGAFTFIYSPREGTPAATYENLLTEEEKHQRLNRLVEKTNEGYLKGHQRFLGQVVKVLVDGQSKNNPEYMTGYSEHRKVVNFKPIKANVGDIVSVKITEAKTWFMNGEQVDE
jgi:tRNA-2-methylthio-N6-dimethylallyladenosine synthase